MLSPTLYKNQRASGAGGFAAATRDAAGNFFITQLERFDPKIYEPLVSTTYLRDIRLREDVQISTDISSFSQLKIGSLASAAQPGTSWIDANVTSIGAANVDTNKVENPMKLWAQLIQYTIVELERSMKLQQPIDQQKLMALRIKYNMDMDRLVYIGDPSVSSKGLASNPDVSVSNASVSFSDSSVPVDAVLKDINLVLNQTWQHSGYAVVPSKLLMAPSDFSVLAGRLNSQAGNSNVLQYIANNCITSTMLGRPLEILPVKWLENAGADGKKRMIAYTDDMDYVRIPMVPLQKTPVEQRSIWWETTYYAAVGGVEFVYPETIGYMDMLDKGSLPGMVDYDGAVRG